MILIVIIFLVCYFLFVALTLYRVITSGKLDYLLYYVVGFLPFYIVFQSIVYQYTESEILIKIIQYSKEFVILGALGYWLVSRKNIFHIRWGLNTLDLLFISFLSLSFLYLLIGVGEAAFVNQAVYFKNILLMCLMYFLGRNCDFQFEVWSKAFFIVFSVTVIALIVVSIETLTDTHFHSFIDFGKYNLGIYDLEPNGSYGLTWTFEAQGFQKRFGSVFSNPLEFAASMLISFSAAIIFFLSVPFQTNRIKYFVLFVATFICLTLAYSRAAFVAYFLMLFFMAIVLKYYKLIWMGIVAAVFVGLYVFTAAPLEIRYFVMDTIMFENSSSITHLLEWVEAVESIKQNPMGTGLATSGNAGGVDSDLKIGGENQFLVFGVQLGWLGLLLYLSMIILAIKYSWDAFKLARNRSDQLISFIASTSKFGLLLPLFTANAESYLYVSFFSWWMVGFSSTIRDREKLNLGLKSATE